MKEQYIDSDVALLPVCELLNRQQAIALDTEFLREKTYYAKLCLLQIATRDAIYCIDPLRLSTLEPLLGVFYNTGVYKVMHAARQDLEMFFDMKGTVPGPIFDTQIAAAILGYGEQLGYAPLVKTMLGVDLDKAHTRSDWSRRPLDARQLTYAMDDVRYLLEIHDRMLNELDAKGRRNWIHDDLAELSDVNLYQRDVNDLWQRVRGVNTLRGVQLAVLQELAIWREDVAKQSDKPRRWIVKDELMIELARLMPTDGDALKRLRGWEGGVLGYQTQLIERIEIAKQRPNDSWPRQARPPRLSTEQESLVDALMAILRQRAVENQIAPAAIGSRKDLDSLVASGGAKGASQLTHGWRLALVGKDLLDFLAGKRELGVQDGKLQIRATE